MANSKEQQILRLAETVRKEADAFIVVGIMPGGRFFYSCDDRITLPDLHGELERSINAVCGSISNDRVRRAKERRNP